MKKGVICLAVVLSMASNAYLMTNATIPNPKIEAIKKDTSIRQIYQEQYIKALKMNDIQLKQPEPLYSQSDLDLLSRLIYAEVGDCSDQEQLLVGNVVLNRVASSKFPNTINDVIYQRHQYQTVNNGKINNPASEQAIKNARILLEGQRVCPDTILYQSEFKHLGTGVYMKIGTEYFCYG